LKLAVFPDVKPGLTALRDRGFRLAILSNGSPAMLDAGARNANIASLFDAILSADDVRVFKPSPDVYRLAITRLNATPEQVGFVSSNSWDINGAASAGLRTFWIQRSTVEPAEELGFAAERIVSTLTELAAVL
jgi:2-haloacid dehalogenase